MDTKGQIIDKLKKIINHLKKRIDEQFDPLFWTKLQKMESELAALESQPSEPIQLGEASDAFKKANSYPRAICTNCKHYEKGQCMIHIYANQSKGVDGNHSCNFFEYFQSVSHEPNEQKHETEGYGNPSTTDFVLNQSIKISNEEIEKEGRKHYNSFKGNAFSVRLIAWCTGAKWLNDKLSSK